MLFLTHSKRMVQRNARSRTPRNARSGTRGSTTVLIGRFGEEPVSVTIRGLATVGAALDAAGIKVDTAEHIWLNGARAELASRVRNGDIVSVVMPREGGR